MNTKDLLVLWCAGLGINTEVLNEPAMVRAIADQDGLAGYEVLDREAKPYPGGKMDDFSGPRYQLEFMSIINGKPMLFA